MRLLILSFLCVIVLLVDWYCYKAILNSFKKWTPTSRNAFQYIWWGVNGIIILGVFAAIFFNIYLTLRAIILVAFFLLTMAKLFMLPFLLIDDIRILIKRLTRPRAAKPLLTPAGSGTAGGSETFTDSPTDVDKISRSQFLTKAGLIMGAIPLSSLSWGIVSGAYDYQIKNVKLVLPNLPKAFEGMKIAQVSDIHSGSFYNKKAVLGGVEMLLKEKPEMVFFTGDLVNNMTSEMKDYQDIFAKINAPLGVYSILGNHDYGFYHFGQNPSAARQRNFEDMLKTHKNLGYDLLMNEHRRIKVDGEEIGVLGVENWGMGRFPKIGRLDQAVENTDDLPVKLLLSHDPSHWRGEILPKYQSIDATFSGHTHGMQFGVRLDDFQWSPVKYIYPEWAGLYKNGNQQLYVNTGFGFLGYPGRVGILPEITIFELART
ncbi:MAG: metallophosphoesterase [Pedobacter sp.]|nr:MAG: metallophosphoesterase [Pedobacter sp.]